MGRLPQQQGMATAHVTLTRVILKLSCLSNIWLLKHLQIQQV